MSYQRPHQAVILIETSDRKGLVAQITGFFFDRNFNILSCQQYADTLENRYFMRLKIDLADMTVTRAELEREFGELAGEFNLHYSIHYTDDVRRMAIMCSKASHCLYDLLMRQDEGNLPVEIPLIISNHSNLEEVADRFNIPFYTFPITPETKRQQENQVVDILKKHRIDVVVMARYMQILSDEFINEFPNRIINIHHAFLPAFQGGNPYQRAWERGVKMIGATAHYATPDLDEGPIIEQDVERINHEYSPEDLRELGQDIERRVLTRAVQAHLEHRVIITGHRTVVFSR